MIKIKFHVRPFIKANNQVAVRVRWNEKASEVTFITGVYAEKSKWDDDLHKAKKGTTHKVRKMSFSYSDINSTIAEFVQEIENTFYECSLRNIVPTQDELKLKVNNALGRNEEEIKVVRRKSFKELLDDFLSVCGMEKNWDADCKEKYVQAYQHLTKAVPKATPDNINKEAMYKLRDWYANNGYKNRTVNHQIIMLKSLLRWINNQPGYSIPAEVLNFETNLKVMKRVVTYLRYDELISFAKFKFTNERLAFYRDLWCFMAFTSLRYSDLKGLCNAHIHDNRIEMMAEKTDELLVIPLTDGALEILARHKKPNPQPSDTAFDVPSNQKLNDGIKEAAKAAGIDRVIINSYYVGTKRLEDQHPFYEIIACHDARRTFVSCSLAMGIPPQVVMKCTGHSDYDTMKPYIETATETQSLEMAKWNRSQSRSQIISLLDKASEEQLMAILDFVNKKVV